MKNRTFWMIAAWALAICSLLAAAATTTIGQKGKQFSQTEITIKVGDTLKFINDDTVVHNVFCPSDAFKFNKVTKPGEETEVLPTGEGTYEVRCAIHPQMKMIVHVEK